MTSNMRVPHQMLATNAVANLRSSFARVVDLQDQAASGKRLRKASDAPSDVATAMQLRSRLDRNDQYSRNLDDATGWLSSADTALSGAIDQLHRVHDLALMARNGSVDTSARQAIASEIDALRQSLLGLANSQFAGRALFAGSASGGVAYQSDGTYVGLSTPIERSIAPGQRVQVNLDGDTVFGAPGNDIFTTLASLSAAIASGPGDLEALGATLEAQTRQVESSQGVVGARLKRVEDQKAQNTSDELTMRENLTNIEDVDLAQVLVNLQAQQLAYQAALSATAKAIQPSLADFLR